MATVPFLGGRPVPFREAFPNIGDFRIEIEQDCWNFHTLPKWQRTLIFTPSHPPPETVRCVNPRCQQGGLLLRNYLYTADMRNGPWKFEETFSCHGHEGSPQGRRIGRPCDVAWKVMMDFPARAITDPKDRE